MTGRYAAPYDPARDVCDYRPQHARAGVSSLPVRPTLRVVGEGAAS